MEYTVIDVLERLEEIEKEAREIANNIDVNCNESAKQYQNINNLAQEISNIKTDFEKST